MSVPWLKNILGMECTDFELLQVPNPQLELTIHVTFKGVQLGTLAGTLVGPLAAAVQGRSSCTQLQSSAVNGGLYGALFGLVATPLWTAYYTRNMTTTQLYDRCCRLRFNRAALMSDRGVGGTALLGTVIGGPVGFVVGMDVGVVLSVMSAYASSLKKK